MESATDLPRPGGYSIEVAIPISMVVPAPAVSGTLLGFNWGIDDDDDGGRRDKHLLWADSLISTVSGYGDMQLTGPVGSVATATPTASATATSVTPATPTAAPPLRATATPTATPTATRTAVSGSPTSTRTATPT